MFHKPQDASALRASERGRGLVRPIQIQKRHPSRVQLRLALGKSVALTMRTNDLLTAD